jgi:hypothetical protein
MQIDQSRLDLARAVGLLRMKERLAQTGTAAQKAALSKEIDKITNDAPAEFKQAQQMVKVEKAKNTPALKDTAWDAEVAKDKAKRVANTRQPTVPVDMTTNTTDLAPLLSGSGTSSFKKVYDALAAYEAKKNVDPEKAQELLQAFEHRAERWLNEHPKDPNPNSVTEQRRQKLKELCEQASFEQARFSKGEAEKRYMGNVVNANVFTKKKPPTAEQEADPDVKFRFNALTDASRDDVRDNVIGNQTPINNPHGLTAAEIAAIRIFSDENYGYINPATANSTAWLQDNIAKGDPAGAFTKGAVTESDYMSEGVVHVGVAVSGLLKLPVHAGDVYRGVATTQGQLRSWVKDGFRFDALGSASANRSTAEDFADKKCNASKPIQVIMVLHNAGGRDIADISVNPVEAEITILPGSKFTHKSLKKLDDQPKVKGGAWWELELDKE